MRTYIEYEIIEKEKQQKKKVKEASEYFLFSNKIN